MNFTKTALAFGSAIGVQELLKSIQRVSLNDVLELPVVRLDGIPVDRLGWAALLCARAALALTLAAVAPSTASTGSAQSQWIISRIRALRRKS